MHNSLSKKKKKNYILLINKKFRALLFRKLAIPLVNAKLYIVVYQFLQQYTCT